MPKGFERIHRMLAYAWLPMRTGARVIVDAKLLGLIAHPLGSSLYLHGGLILTGVGPDAFS
jgi:hypothetical protein